jgi:glycyl-tRNA synthetase beta chain/uncharacterized protein
MYPFGPAPTTREGWVLVLADKLASLLDMSHFVGGLFSGHSLRQRRRLRQSDPFLQQHRRQNARHRTARLFRRNAVPGR